ncbi:hypothetical protein [Cohnella zeiphila]|uniref:Uncharacterized protein n=1 Tax=Cohnella zeiphila TaxID=2761120 RepID=A0A7X0SHI1_9BACL|nr:hypothetical protein [Cohnella zeiphila]MBB6729956.1 hypothetical protein [Cohnella zeiphila]
MHWLLRLYPRIWRERYEEEMLAMLEDHKITPATVFDLLIGAVDAHLNYRRVEGGKSETANLVRSGILMIFWAFLLFGAGGCLLQRIADPMPIFQQEASTFPAIGFVFDAIVILGCMASVSFLAGGLLLIYMSVRRGVTGKQSDILKRFGIAIVCLILFAVTAVWGMRTPQPSLLNEFLMLFALLFIAVGTVAVSQMIARTEFILSELKWVFIPKIIISLSMIISLVLAIVFIIMIISHAPQLIFSQDMDRQMFSMTGVIFMALGTIFASLGLRRGGIDLAISP